MICDQESVTVLATLPPALLGERVAACKFHVQNGVVYHLISELTEREVERILFMVMMRQVVLFSPR